MSTKIPTIKLSNGVEFPNIGLGTWQSGDKTKEIIKDAIDMGYRLIDCAMVYDNETQIGLGIKAKIQDGTVSRKELFVSTKLWNTFHEYEQVVPTCKLSLKNLGLDYVDLYLIHWPVAQRTTTGKFNVKFPFNDAVGYDYDYVETWKGMEKCVELGLAKSIGLANFNSQQIDRILSMAKIKPVMNQVEVNPNWNQKKLIKFCKDRGIAITAYSPLGSPGRSWIKPGDLVLDLNHPKFVKISKKYGKTVAQVILRYLIEIGTIPIPKSSNKGRMHENINVFDFKLDAEDIEIIDSFDGKGRVFPVEELKDMPNYPFHIEF